MRRNLKKTEPNLTRLYPPALSLLIPGLWICCIVLFLIRIICRYIQHARIIGFAENTIACVPFCFSQRCFTWRLLNGIREMKKYATVLLERKK